MMCLIVLAAGASAQGAGRDSLFSTPSRLECTEDSIRIAGTLDPLREYFGAQAWVVAAPAGAFDIEHHALVLRHSRSGESRTMEGAELTEQLRRDRQLDKAFEVADLGIFRRVRLLAVRLNPQARVVLNRDAYAVVSFDVTLNFHRASQPRRIDDTGFTDPASCYRRLVDLAVSNPEWIERYALAEPPAHNHSGREPSPWQPLPDLSPGQPWLKIPIAEDGAYTIDGRWLAENGIDAGSVRPDELQLVADGQEVAMLPVGPANATFAGGARLVFYAFGNRSRETRERLYFLGRRPETEEPVFFPTIARAGEDAPRVETYRRKVRIEQDNTLQTRLGNFLSIREMTWVWEELKPEETHRFEFTVDGMPEPTPEARGRVTLYTAGRGLAGPITVRVALNGREIEPGARFSAGDESFALTVPAGLLRHDRNTIELTVHVPEAFRTRSLPPIFLDAIDLTYPSLLKAAQMSHLADFATDDTAPQGTARLRAVGFRPYRLLGLDVTDANRLRRLPVEENGGVAWVSANLEANSRLLLVEDDGIPRAPAARPSAWRDWRSMRHGADALVIHHTMFAEQAERVAADMRAGGREVLTVEVESLYDAYTAGELTAAAIQLFVRDAVLNWQGRKPVHVLLIGDSTSDGQNRARNDVKNLLPTYTYEKPDALTIDEYASDQYFAWLAGEDEGADVIVGRLSVASVEDADEVVRKTLVYRTLEPAEWTGRMLTVTDPGEFYDMTEKLRRATLAPGFDDRAINLAEYPWEDNFYLPREVIEGSEIKVSPTVTSLIEHAVNDGKLLVTFIGHGSPNIWSNQRIWFGGDSENSDNLRLTNGDRLPFLVAFTCNNGAIDYPMPRWNICIAEDMMRVRGGGYAGMFVPSGPGFSRNHLRLAEGFHDAMGKLEVREFGLLAELSRLKYQGVMGPDDHSRMFLLLGDPTLVMPVMRTDADLELTPELLPAAAGMQAIDIRLQASARLTSGTALLKSPHDQIMAEVELTPQADGSLRGTLRVEIPTDEFKFDLVARAADEAGRLYQTGRPYYRGPADVAITEVREGAYDASGSREITYFLENRSPFAQETTVEVFLHRATDRERIVSTAVHLPAGGTGAVRATVGTPSDRGAFLIEGHVSPSRAHSRDVKLPSSVTFDAVVLGELHEGVDVALVPGAFRLLPARAHTSSPMVETFVANLGTDSVPCTVHWKIEYPGGDVVEGSKVVGTVNSGATMRTQIPMKMEMQMRTDLKVELYGEPDGANRVDANPENNRLTAVLEAGRVPDLRIVPESVRVLPGHLAEGLTVFVDGEVENAGRQPSHAVRVHLFGAEDEAMREPLRTLAGQLHNRIPPLEPGERWPFRVRWDPVQNLGVKEVKLLVDSEQSLVESDKANNLVRVPLDIKSKWDLRARGIRLASASATSVYLVAAIENVGETDARQVNVWFYGDEAQTPENFLGEVLVPRIPAKQRVEVPFEWDLTGEDLQRQRRPSFAMALKGSLQRVSSVADQ